ncbi:MAG: nucleotidyltransferase family protein [Spirulinaceae cyanobacterium]
MNQNDVLAIVLKHQIELQKMGVKFLNLFGSFARNEAREDSDVDFFVEFNRPVSLFDFLAIKLYLEDILGRSVDLGTLETLRENSRKPALQDVIDVF